MQTWIALFRGINVGGKNILPMASLVSELETLGLQNIRTYIQSGNVLFDSPLKKVKPLTNKISSLIEDRYGFRPHVFLLTKAELENAISENPFRDVVTDPKTLHFLFLQSAPSKVNLKAIDDAKTPTEKYSRTDHVFYFFAPDGIGRSKLAQNAEKHLGVVTTGRNYRTVKKLASMISEG